MERTSLQQLFLALMAGFIGAVLAIAVIGLRFGDGPGLTSLPSEPLHASMDLTCPNGKVYKLDTGTNDGQCSATVVDGVVTGGSCVGPPNDSNGANASCANGCTGSKGSGSCTNN